MAFCESHDESAVSVNDGMTADLKWFKRFLKKYSRKSFIKTTEPAFIIEADACPSGGGATDFHHFIAYEFPARMKDMHISVLEAVNCLVACRAFFTKEKHSKTILLKCDNVAAMESFARGAARDKFLATISRAMWYCMARADIQPIYQYTPGKLMVIPDALSRIAISSTANEAHSIQIVPSNCPPAF